MTYDEILESALNRIPANFDKRIGSVIYDAIAPCCYELAKTYEQLEKNLLNTFAGTAEREYLILRAQEINLSPYPSSKAIRKGVFSPSNIDVLNKRFNYDNVNFIAVEQIGNGVYKLECEQAGEIGNNGAGTLIPIDYISGLESAELIEEVLIYGENEETTENFRKRYFETLKNEAIDGNIAQYKQWCNDFAGIGNNKIIPQWQGTNSVKVSILNSENGIANSTLINDFQNYLDPTKNGLGNGKAPIGAIVTVSTATEKNINISCNVTLKSGYVSVVGLEEDLKEYFKNIAYETDRISYISVGSIILNNQSIESVSNLYINNIQGDVVLGTEEIAKLNNLSVVVG